MINNALNLNQNAKYFFNLGYCYAMMADNQKALRYFNLAWALDNDDESRIVAMSFCEPRSWTRVLSS